MGEKKETFARNTKTAFNAEKQGKKRKKSSKKFEKDLNLNDVLSLGGTKEDFELLQDISHEKWDDKNSQSAEKNIKKEEIQSLIKGLGFKTTDCKKQLSKKKLPDNFNWGEMMPDSKDLKMTKSKSNDEDRKEKSQVEKKSINQKTEPGKKKSKNKYRPQSEFVNDNTTKKSGNKETRNNKVSSMTNSSSKKMQNKKGKDDNLIIKAGDVWFNLLEDIKCKQDSVLPAASKWTGVKSLESEAAQLYQNDVEKYREQRNKSKKFETEWYEKIVSSGTLSDKQAALQLFIAESPVHNLSSLDSLIAMSKKKGRRECITAAEAIKDVLIKNILPKNRQLISFNAHKMHELHENKRQKQLLLWYFEGELKRRFSIYVESLVAMLQDNVDAPKEKALSIISSLLAHTTEEQSILLNILVNKVGDPNYKIASKTVYILTKLLKICPVKKLAVIDEVEKLICRPNMQQKSLYYSFCFLSNLRLKEGESRLAERLIKIYFSFFQRFIKQGELDNRMLSVLLAGVNFAFPIILENHEFIQEQMDTLHKIIHLVNFNTSLQILMLLYQIMESSDNLSDRFYMVLYRKLCDPTLKNSNRQVHFLNLLFRAIKKDYAKARIKAFVKRLLQICCYQSSPFVCGALCLLSELYREKPDLLNLKNLSENFDNDDDEHFKDIDPDSDKNSDNEDEKRIQIETEKQKIYNSDSEKESEFQNCLTELQETAVSSWIHRKNLQTVPTEMTYVPSHRNPLYCRAETTPLWELQKLSFHYHPTVSLYASTLLSGKFIEFEGDPLQDYTLMRFLDRFVFKNPKKVEKLKDPSAPKKRLYQPTGIKLVPANSSKYLEDESSIPVEEKYLYRYFVHKDAVNKQKGIFSDDEEVDDDEFDGFIEHYEGTNKDYELNNFDFYHELSKQTGKNKSFKDDFSSGSEMEDADESDEDVDFGDGFMSEFKDLDGNEDGDDGDVEDNEFANQGVFDEEDIEFSDTDSDVGIQSDNDDEHASQRKKLKKSIKDSQENPKDVSKLFLSAEEFSSMLDEGHSTKSLGSQALVNRDKASAKQLKWEMERERWMKGMNWKSKKSKQNTLRKKKNYGNHTKIVSGAISKKLKKKSSKKVQKR